jgi:glycosyltransferase involved in cell wall biosynthesis
VEGLSRLVSNEPLAFVSYATAANRGRLIVSLSLSVIVPAYNEQRTIGKLFHAIFHALPSVYEVIVVDDGSTDKTAEIAFEYSQLYPRVRVIKLGKNHGKTGALKAGFAASTGDIVIVQDADLEYDPEDIFALIGPIETGKADVVYGSRFLVRRATRVIYFRHYLANRFITFLSNIFTDMNFSDVETGYKAFRGEIIRNMVIKSKGFGFEIEVTAKIAKIGCRVYEVPISYHGRTYREGKKIGFWDGLAALYYVVKYNLFCPQRKAFIRIPQSRPCDGSDLTRF